MRQQMPYRYLVLIALLAALVGCAVQRHTLNEDYDPKGKVVSRHCETESKAFWKVTEVEALRGTIACDSSRDTTFGAENLKTRGDVEMAGVITKAAVEAAIKAAPVPGL